MTEQIIGWVAKDLDGVHLFLEDPIFTEVSHEWLGWADSRGRTGRLLDRALFKDLACDTKKEVLIIIDDTKVL